MNLSEDKLTPQQVAAERRKMHVEHLREGVEELRRIMHAAEGSVHPGEHQEHLFASRRMSLAATYLEIAEMFAIKAALE